MPFLVCTSMLRRPGTQALTLVYWEITGNSHLKRWTPQTKELYYKCKKLNDENKLQGGEEIEREGSSFSTVKSLELSRLSRENRGEILKPISARKHTTGKKQVVE